MISYETWQNVKEECRNDAQVVLQRMSPEAQNAMKDAHAAGAIIEVVNAFGEWVALSEPSWHCGLPHRVSTSWPGPAKPEPVPEYEDKNVFLAGAAYKFIHPEDGSRWFITSAQGTVGFVGYVYNINGKCKIRPRLLFDKQPDGTYRLRVPKAVRFLKGAKA